MSKKSIYQFFWKVSGEDSQILSEQDNAIQNKFLISGVLISFVFIASFVSFYANFKLLFGQGVIAVLLSFFVAFMFYSIYKINIITLHPEKHGFSFSYMVSLLFRLFFIVILGVAMSKSVEVIAFKFMLVIPNKSFLSSAIYLNEEYPIVWLFTLFFLSLLATPFLIKFSISPVSSYNESSNVLNNKLIEDDYASFKINYSNIFTDRFGLEISIAEKYEDPPFNTRRKEDTRKIGTEKDFLKQF